MVPAWQPAIHAVSQLQPLCYHPAGGVGGVHRGGESSLDISADLTELGRTPVAVICAGAKSVLDIPRTLEYLETQVGGCGGGWIGVLTVHWQSWLCAAAAAMTVAAR
jgi:hypothetical protein